MPKGQLNNSQYPGWRGRRLCTSNASEVRKVAGHKEYFCKRHAKEWDQIYEAALNGFEESDG